MNKSALKAKITKALRLGIKGKQSQIHDLIPKGFTAGKLYEAYVLGLVCQRLKAHEHWDLVLIGAKKIVLKSSPGPINLSYPHIQATYKGAHVADIWTDIEFSALSAVTSGKTSFSFGDFHEMDIAVVTPNSSSRPLPGEILLAVECKNTGYQKSLLREILGIRRELSYLVATQNTAFSSWPRTSVPAKPPSCIAVYSTDISVNNYGTPGQVFGIDFFYEPL